MAQPLPKAPGALGEKGRYLLGDAPLGAGHHHVASMPIEIGCKRTAGRHDPVTQILTIGLPPSPSHGIILPRALHQYSLRYSGSLFQALPPIWSE